MFVMSRLFQMKNVPKHKLLVMYMQFNTKTGNACFLATLHSKIGSIDNQLCSPDDIKGL